MKRSKKHIKILNDYDKVKSNHLEKLANRQLKNDSKFLKLKDKVIDKSFLDKF